MKGRRGDEEMLVKCTIPGGRDGQALENNSAAHIPQLVIIAALCAWQLLRADFK